MTQNMNDGQRDLEGLSALVTGATFLAYSLGPILLAFIFRSTAKR